MTVPHLWIRTVVGPQIGFGHIMRCIALAEAGAADGMHPRFVVHHWDALPVLQRRGFSTALAKGEGDLSWLSSVEPADVVIFDGYEFSAGIVHAARDRTVVVRIEDRPMTTHAVDVLVNPNPVEPALSGSCDSTTRLMGPEYALLREEMQGVKGGGEDGHLLLTFGGADPANAAQTALAALPEALPFGHVVLVQGPLADPIENGIHPWLEVIVDPPSMAPLIRDAAAAVSAAGSTTWELLHAGVPTALTEVIENQRPVRTGVVAAGAALDLGTVGAMRRRLPQILDALADPSTRRRLMNRGRATVDGLGAGRVVEIARQLGARRSQAGTR